MSWGMAAAMAGGAILGGAAGAAGSGGGSGTERRAGKAQNRLIKDAANYGRQALHNVQGNPRKYIAPETFQSYDIMRDVAGRPTGYQDLHQLGIDTLQGKYLNPSTNPWLAAAVEASTNPIIRNLTEQALPGLTSSAINQGAYGGTRNSIVSSRLTADTARQAMEVAAQLYYENYARERDRQMAGGSLLREAEAAALSPAQILSSIGSAREAFELNPFRGIAQSMGALSATPYVPEPHAGLWQRILYGAAGGLGIGSSIYGGMPGQAGAGTQGMSRAGSGWTTGSGAAAP